jgi:hypothetical protein
MTKSQIPKSPILRSAISNWSLVIILLMATFFRLYRLDSIPPGLTHDEADTGYFAAAVYRGQPSQVITPYGYAYQPFTMYSAALFMAILGPHDVALHFHSAFFGMVLIVFTYLWARRLFGAAVGLGGAALMAVSFWTVFDSRFALNSAPAPALFTGAAYFLWRALDIRNGRLSSLPAAWKGCSTWGPFVLLLAASFYVYEATLAAAASFGLLWLYLALFDRARFRRHGLWLAIALVLVGLLAAPHLLDPHAWGRPNTLSGPLREALQGNWKPLAANAIGALGTLSFRGDTLVTYNLPGRPIFDPLVSLFLYGGIVLCLARWRRPAYAFTLLWAAMGMVPTLILGEWTSTLHSKVAEAPLMVLPAVCAVEAGRFVMRRFGARWAKAFAAGCAVWLAVVATFTARDYFVRWGQSPDTRAAYFHNLVAIADYLNESDYSGDVALSSSFPDQPLDPFIADMRLRRTGPALRWFDARRALVFPNTADGLFVLPPNTPLDPYFAQRLDLRLVERVHLRPDDVDPYFDVFEWVPNATLDHFLPSSTLTVTAGTETLALPVSFGALELVAYDVPERRVASGGPATVVTIWRVLDPQAIPTPPHAYGRAAVAFTHALDATNDVVGQEDRLDAPAWNWHAGDAFVQIHRFQIDAPAGSYRLEVGIYNRDDMVRLPVLVNGIAVDSRVLLGQGVEVVGR